MESSSVPELSDLFRTPYAPTRITHPGSDITIINLISLVDFYLQDSTPLVVPPIVFGATSLSAGLIAMMLPETRGKPLPDFVGNETSEGEELVVMEDEKEITGYTSTV